MSVAKKPNELPMDNTSDDAGPKEGPVKKKYDFTSIKVSTTEQRGMWRGGQFFSPSVTELKVSDLDPEKLEQILNDKSLKVEKV